MYKCKFCEKEYENGRSLGGHTVYCKKNPNLKNTIDKLSNAVKGDKNPIHSIGAKEKSSNTIKDKIKNGEWHLSFSKSRTHTYKNETFHGMWEVKYAMWLDENAVKWRRPKEKFLYNLDNKEHYYTPDFYLSETKEYIEIKGYPTKKDFAKWDAFPVTLRIINGRELKDLNIIESYKSRNITYQNYSWI